MKLLFICVTSQQPFALLLYTLHRYINNGSFYVLYVYVLWYGSHILQEITPCKKIQIVNKSFLKTPFL